MCCWANHLPSLSVGSLPVKERQIIALPSYSYLRGFVQTVLGKHSTQCQAHKLIKRLSRVHGISSKTAKHGGSRAGSNSSPPLTGCLGELPPSKEDSDCPVSLLQKVEGHLLKSCGILCVLCLTPAVSPAPESPAEPYHLSASSCFPPIFLCRFSQTHLLRCLEPPQGLCTHCHFSLKCLPASTWVTVVPP